jgi:hypothetical protein
MGNQTIDLNRIMEIHITSGRHLTLYDIMKTQKLFFINYTLSLSKDNEAARRRLRRRI